MVEVLAFCFEVKPRTSSVLMATATELSRLANVVVLVVVLTMCSAADRDYSLDLYVDFCLDSRAGCSLARDCWFAFDTSSRMLRT